MPGLKSGQSAVAPMTRAPERSSALTLLSYQVSILKQDDHELAGLQFTAVRTSSPGYARDA